MTAVNQFFSTIFNASRGTSIKDFFLVVYDVNTVWNKFRDYDHTRNGKTWYYALCRDLRCLHVHRKRSWDLSAVIDFFNVFNLCLKILSFTEMIIFRRDSLYEILNPFEIPTGIVILYYIRFFWFCNVHRS